MKKIYGVFLIAVLLSTIVFVGTAVADDGGMGPAPNSGDGDCDGSGFDRTEWPNADTPAQGPAPNSGDGDPDGSGF